MIEGGEASVVVCGVFIQKYRGNMFRSLVFQLLKVVKSRIVKWVEGREMAERKGKERKRAEWKGRMEEKGIEGKEKVGMREEG